MTGQEHSDLRARNVALAVLLATVAVILLGAVVRATHSGAGCGSHWPDCNGEIVPHAPGQKTVIEFTHRVTSGLDMLAVFALYGWLRRRKGTCARSYAGWASIFMIVEAALGAGIVLLRYVEHNASLARAAWTAMHLSNTFLLLGALSLCVFALHTRSAKAFSRRFEHGLALALLIGVAALGAVTALGDTLFPVNTLREGLRQDFAAFAANNAHGMSREILVKLRVIHPFFAVFASYWWWRIFSHDGATPSNQPTPERAALAKAGQLTIVLQVLCGLLNIVLMAPVFLQLAHVLLADLLWCTAVCYVANSAEPNKASNIREANSRVEPRE